MDQVLKALPFLRNKLGGHGQGAAVVDIPPAYGDLAVQIAAAFQNFLITKHLERSPAPVPPPPTKSHKPWDLAKAIAWIPARAVAARTRSGEVIWILTTLPNSVPALAVMGLYRLRWQIELLFKRLKSLLHLDTLPSRQGPTAKSWMLARFLAAALAQRLVEPNGPLSPWGYELRNRPEPRSDQVSA